MSLESKNNREDKDKSSLALISKIDLSNVFWDDRNQKWNYIFCWEEILVNTYFFNYTDTLTFFLQISTPYVSKRNETRTHVYTFNICERLFCILKGLTIAAWSLCIFWYYVPWIFAIEIESNSWICYIIIWNIPITHIKLCTPKLRLLKSFEVIS